MAQDLTQLDDALEVIEVYFSPVPADAALLLEQLAARDCSTGVTVYRPYAVLAGLFGLRWNQYKSLRSASGSTVEFGNVGSAQRWAEGTQSVFDRGLCDVPGGFGGSDVFKVVL